MKRRPVLVLILVIVMGMIILMSCAGEPEISNSIANSPNGILCLPGYDPDSGPLSITDHDGMRVLFVTYPGSDGSYMMKTFSIQTVGENMFWKFTGDCQ